MTSTNSQQNHIVSVTGFLKVIEEFELQWKHLGTPHDRHRHIRFWYRGQSVSESTLVPGVYRTTETGSFIESDDEKARLKKEQLLFQDFTVLSAGIRSGLEEDAEIYFLQQHYGLPTRLLDWTTNPLSALFFSVNKDPEKDGEVFMMDVMQLSLNQEAGQYFEGIMTTRNPKFRKDAISPIANWGSPCQLPEFILPIRPHHKDRRIVLQQSCFTFHVPDRHELSVKENKTLKCHIVPKDQKRPIREQLFRLGVDEFSIYGDLDGLCKRLMRAYDWK